MSDVSSLHFCSLLWFCLLLFSCFASTDGGLGDVSGTEKLFRERKKPWTWAHILLLLGHFVECGWLYKYLFKISFSYFVKHERLQLLCKLWINKQTMAIIALYLKQMWSSCPQSTQWLRPEKEKHNICRIMTFSWKSWLWCSSSLHSCGPKFLFN